MTDDMKYTFRKRGTGRREIIVFEEMTNGGAKVLIEIPLSVVRRADWFVTDLTEGYHSDGLPEASVTISTKGRWEVEVSKWWENPEVKITLREYQTLLPLRTWDMIEVDPF